jgi:hypothetical protein
VAAVAASVAVHAGLFIALAFAPSDDAPSVPSAPVDLVVVVGDAVKAPDHAAPPVELPSYVPQSSPKLSELVDDPPAPNSLPPEPDTVTHAPPQPLLNPGSIGTGQADSGPGMFPAAGTGRSVVFVLDRSMSMGMHDGFRRARAELLASLARLPSSARFQVIAYKDIAEPLMVSGSAGLLPADRDTIAEVTRLVAGMRAEGRTNHVNALKHGLMLLPDVLYFVTDADELSVADVTGVTRFNGGRTSIHVVEMSARADDGSDTVLHQLAIQNRGTYRRVSVRQ